MKPFDVQFIGIDAHVETAFRYIADPANLPQWTHAFRRVEGRSAELSTPKGIVTIDLRVDADMDARTVDWVMTFPDESVGRAHSRLIRNVDDSAIFTFVLLAPAVPQEQVEGTLEQQKLILQQELLRLKRLLQSDARA